MKPKLLIIELWGVGDLAIATPFIRKASEQFDVTVLAKPFAFDLQPRFWPSVKILPFNAPWTAFAHASKYNLFHWPWREMFALRKNVRREHFDTALSARRDDPRDHVLLKMSRAKRRLGFPRIGSQVFLTDALAIRDLHAHRYDHWRLIAQALDLDLESRDDLRFQPRSGSRAILIHTGAARSIRVWPLQHYSRLVKQLRTLGHEVRVLCNPDQLAWWQNAGEKTCLAPDSISKLLNVIDEAGLFIGNDSGPGHLAAICGLPTFTLFGPQVPEWFVPIHQRSEFFEGKACPYKPCSDYCRFSTPFCLTGVSFEDAWPRIATFIERNSPVARPDSTPFILAARS